MPRKRLFDTNGTFDFWSLYELTYLSTHTMFYDEDIALRYSSPLLMDDEEKEVDDDAPLVDDDTDLGIEDPELGGEMGLDEEEEEFI